MGDWIRYTHSFDGGLTWTTPFTVDRADDTEDELRQPYPGLAVAGDTVHMVYAGNSTTQREHRYSLDRGVTWSETKRVMGNLQGQALGMVSPRTAWADCTFWPDPLAAGCVSLSLGPGQYRFRLVYAADNLLYLHQFR